MNRLQPNSATEIGLRNARLGIAVNLILAVVKGVAGVIGNSYALIADAIESASDVVTSVVIAFGFRMAGKPADANHPYGHGKFEPLSAAVVALILLGAAILIAVESVKEILTPHHSPAPFTLCVLVVVVVIKEALFRTVLRAGETIHSTALKTDAWHHRADAITSLAAFVGISIALIGGRGYESADDFAALIASVVIAINACLLIRPALLELIDTAPDPKLVAEIRAAAQQVPGVLGTHKCRVRKLGVDYFVDLDVLCDPDSTIRQGHEIAHDVGEQLHAEFPQVRKVLVHVEPADDYGRRTRD
ncbi:MAG: cation diffusion facilitator family transporter [Pseudomonadota bacterium]